MSEPDAAWETYSPRWCPHVFGRFSPVEVEDGVLLPRIVRARCTVCGTEFKTTCGTGAVRQHVLTFARVHLHKDNPLKEVIVRRRRAE